MMKRWVPLGAGLVLSVVAAAIGFAVGQGMPRQASFPVAHNQGAEHDAANTASPAKCCDTGCQSQTTPAAGEQGVDAILARLDLGNVPCECTAAANLAHVAAGGQAPEAAAKATAAEAVALTCGSCQEGGSCCQTQTAETGSTDTTTAAATTDCASGECASANDAAQELAFVGQGPPWAGGNSAAGRGRGRGGPGMGRGMGMGMGPGMGMGMGMGMGGATAAGSGQGKGCGMVLREAIVDGKVDAQLVQSLITGPRGDVELGSQVFAANCSTCHRLHGQGADIAPDLTNRPRHNPMYVLANLSHPSAVIPSEYQVYVVTTVQGKIVTGLKIEENSDAITICDATNKRTVIPRADIDELQPSKTSLMPDNLVGTLGEDQLRNLLAFLKS